MENSNRQTLKVPSFEKDVDLDVWFYQPPTAPPYPVVVAGHGLTLVKDAGLAAFGERWAKDAGYAALILDYRGFGASGGQPRNLVATEKQLQDYKSVIEWARHRPETFRSDKIVAMGSAFSGLQVANLVVNDPGLAGGMAHCPLLDGYAVLNSGPTDYRLVFWALIDSLKGKLGFSPTFIKAVGRPGELAFLTSPSSYQGFTNMFSQGSMVFDEAPNVIAARVAFEIMGARPGRQLGMAKCPMLVVIAEEDDMIPRSISEQIVKESQGKVELILSPGGHYDVMQGGMGYEVNIDAQIEFLRQLL